MSLYILDVKLATEGKGKRFEDVDTNWYSIMILFM